MSLSHVDSFISAAVFAALLAGGCAGSPPPAGVDASSGSDGAIADAPPSDGRPPTDAPPPPPTDARPTTDAPPPPPDARPPTTCAIADVAWLPSVNQYLVVSTTGRALRLDADGGLISNQPFAAYAGLAAACGASGAGCQLDAVTARSPTQILVVAYGTLWTLDQNLAAVAQQPLTSVPGVAAGPCAGVAGTCHVEALTWRDDTQQYLVIARGNVYSLDATGALVATSPMTSFAGLAAGPCALYPGTCHLAAATFRPPVYQVVDSDGTTATGSRNLYNVDGTTGAAAGTAALTTVPGLAGICQ